MLFCRLFDYSNDFRQLDVRLLGLGGKDLGRDKKRFSLSFDREAN